MIIAPVRRLLAGLVVVGTAAMSTVGVAVAGGTPPPSAPAIEAQRLLDTRVDALARGDRDAWLATVDPAATAGFKEAQARSFDGLRSLPLASFSLTVRLDDTGDLGVGLSERYGGARTFLPETRLRYRLQDYDDRDDVQSLYLTFVERTEGGARWYVAAEDDLSPLGVDSFKGLWDLGPVRVRPTEHFLVMSHPEDAERADALADIGEEAARAQFAAWTEPWLGRIPLVLPHSVEDLATLIQASFDLDTFVAFVAFGVVRDRDWEPTAPRVFVQDTNLNRYLRGFQVHTLAHELTHGASVPSSGPLLPAWVHEGVAEWVAGGAPADEPRPETSDGLLPRDDEFIAGDGESIGLAYRESSSVVSFLTRRFGPGAPAALFKELGARRVAPGAPAYHVDQSLRAVVGMGVDEVQTDWGST